VNVFRPGCTAEVAMHPTVKPVALIADAIRDVTKRGDLILDPFGGSGTVIIAAEKTSPRARHRDRLPLLRCGYPPLGDFYRQGSGACRDRRDV
jgi:DNA methylase